MSSEDYKDYREPDIVTLQTSGTQYIDGTDNNAENLEKAGFTIDLTGDNKVNGEDFKKQIQKEFNSMVASVSKYGGFYVGRYEISLEENKAQSKQDKDPVTNITWYDAYKISKTYSQTGIVSEMIWGCQWDAMLRFILKGEDKEYVTKSDYVGDQHTGIDNMYRTGGTNYPESASIPYQDIANNIYDLSGNLMEWTQEAGWLEGRVFRGGHYINKAAPADRTVVASIKSYHIYCSRLALYIQ